MNSLHAFRRGMPPEEGPPVLREWATKGFHDGQPVELRYSWPVERSSREGERRFRETYPGGTLIESSLS